MEELRELVERGAAQEASEPRGPFGVRPGSVAHRAELGEAEGASAKSGAFLAEDYGRAHGQQDGHCDGSGGGQPERRRREHEQSL